MSNTFALPLCHGVHPPPPHRRRQLASVCWPVPRPAAAGRHTACALDSVVHGVAAAGGCSAGGLVTPLMPR